MGFLSLIFGALDPITKIGEQIARYKIAAANAQTDQARLAAEERVKTLESKRDVLIAEAGSSKVNAVMRALLAAPVAALLWKVFVWDKALGQWTHGRTDALSPELWHVVTAVLGFYFLYEGAVGVTRILRR
jgi:hypothetical protein